MLRDCELQHEQRRQRYLYQHRGHVLGEFCCRRVSGTERHRGEFQFELQNCGKWVEGAHRAIVLCAELFALAA